LAIKAQSTFDITGAEAKTTKSGEILLFISMAELEMLYGLYFENNTHTSTDLLIIGLKVFLKNLPLYPSNFQKR